MGTLKVQISHRDPRFEEDQFIAVKLRGLLSLLFLRSSWCRQRRRPPPPAPPPPPPPPPPTAPSFARCPGRCNIATISIPAATWYELQDHRALARGCARHYNVLLQCGTCFQLQHCKGVLELVLGC